MDNTRRIRSVYVKCRPSLRAALLYAAGNTMLMFFQINFWLYQNNFLNLQHG